jgi:capsular polysaccharide export protein
VKVKINYSISGALIQEHAHFLKIDQYTLWSFFTLKKGCFVGWGRKTSGRIAVYLAKFFGTEFLLIEDGFVRSVGLGVEGSPSYSIVKDDLGIYYDATGPSRLEVILNSTEICKMPNLLTKARLLIEKIKVLEVSKYNNGIPFQLPNEFNGPNVKKILIVAQTKGDSSLKYGLANQFSTRQMIDAAIEENPGAQILLKVHPDTLTGKKSSDIDVSMLPSSVSVLTEFFNPISLLKHVDHVYTKTSQMGFEALLLGKKVTCFGMPFYAGWGITDDRVYCERRQAERSVEEVFAAAYLLYSEYVDPTTRKRISLDEVIENVCNNVRVNK